MCLLGLFKGLLTFQRLLDTVNTRPELSIDDASS